MRAKMRNPSRCIPSRFIIGAVCLIMGWVSVSNAHPHMWVDLKSQIILDGNDKVSAIYQEWLFDDFFSAAMLEEAALHPDGVEVAIKQKAAELMENLKPYNYFTLAKRDGVTLPLIQQGEAVAEIRENRFWMGFTVLMKSPVDPASQAFSYAIFDPTYYIEMYHAEGETISFQGTAPDNCRTEILQPNPSADAIALSQSSSLDDNPDTTIGRLFAETIHVTCK
ncbi:DUF1007 family protein [Candidatus Puniceispirillum sp.]|uniref:DUF1007 family protein n=1 Tax=Candidatus Puniceispirillum sp. TaxID=2026719 RepID=UPI003F69A61E